MVTKRLLRVFQKISTDARDDEPVRVQMLETIDGTGADLVEVGVELSGIEEARYLDADELDIFKSLLVYILMRDSSCEPEEILSVVFGGGKRITWH